MTRQDPAAIPTPTPNARPPTRVATARGFTEVLQPVPQVVLLRLGGIATEEDFPPVQDALLKALGTHPTLSLFADTVPLVSFSAGYRRLWTEWLGAYRHRFESVHALHCSALVAMAVPIVNLAMGGKVHGYRDRGEFEAALARACR